MNILIPSPQGSGNQPHQIYITIKPQKKYFSNSSVTTRHVMAAQNKPSPCLMLSYSRYTSASPLSQQTVSQKSIPSPSSNNQQRRLYNSIRKSWQKSKHPISTIK